MVARSASQADGFSPIEPPWVSVSADGALAAVREPTRITIVELPSAAAFAEIGVDPDALGSDVAWVGVPPRLIVLSRYQDSSTAHLLDVLDPLGPRTTAEIPLDAPMRLFATVGSHALVVGARHATVLVASESHLMPYQFPSRAIPVVAGAAAGQFLVALSASIEEWDPQSRTPKRRLRLPRAAMITAVGGSERLVWITTQQEPARIDVIPLVNRGQPKAHDLPEPLAGVAGHPRSDLVVCIGADSGRLYVVDLDGRMPLRLIETEATDPVTSAALVVGRMVGVLAAQAGSPLTVVPLDGRDLDPGDLASSAVLRWKEPAQRSRMFAAAPDESMSGESVSHLTVRAEAAAGSMEHAGAAPGEPAPYDVTPHEPGDEVPVDAMSAVQSTTDIAPHHEVRLSWRDHVAAWSRAVRLGRTTHTAPRAPLIDAVLARFDLEHQLQPVLVLLYGAHLCGELGVAPVDVAHVLDRRWEEALGRGELARRGVATYAGSRVTLSPVVLRVLDELPPLAGTLVGEPGSGALPGPCFVVAGDEPLSHIAKRCLSSVGGAILVTHHNVNHAELTFEARAYGAAPMLRAHAGLDTVPTNRAIFVVADADAAERLGVPPLT